jgi:hypothetical protein
VSERRLLLSSLCLESTLTQSPPLPLYTGSFPVYRIDLVYNSRKRTGDTADRYFKATELIAGVKDMRFQALMPDVLHWLGVQKIDNMISMVSRRPQPRNLGTSKP